MLTHLSKEIFFTQNIFACKKYKYIFQVMNHYLHSLVKILISCHTGHTCNEIIKNSKNKKPNLECKSSLLVKNEKFASLNKLYEMKKYLQFVTNKTFPSFVHFA